MLNKELITTISPQIIEEARKITECDIQNIKDNYKVVKTNALVNAGYNVNLNEFKIYYAIVSQIAMSDKDIYWYAISKEHIDYICNINSSNMTYKALKSLRDAAFCKTITLEIYDKGEKTSKEIEYHLFSGVITDKSKWYFKLNPDLKPFFIGLKRDFSEEPLKNYMVYRTILGLRLHDYFITEYNRQTCRMTVDEKLSFQMHFYFDLDQLKKLSNKRGAYDRYNNFKAQILKPAIADIEKNNYWKIIVTEIKDDTRSVQQIRFDVQIGDDNPKIRLLHSQEARRASKQVEKVKLTLRKIGFTRENIHDAMEYNTIPQIVKILKKSKGEADPTHFIFDHLVGESKTLDLIDAL